MMARPGYDPNRIPMPIFSSRPTNLSSWSHTSIQAGNNSFTGNKCAESPRFAESISNSTALHRVEEVVPSNCSDNDIEGQSDSFMVKHCESVKTLAESETIVLNETPGENKWKEEQSKNKIREAAG